MDHIQAGILRPLPTQASYLSFQQNPSADSQTIMHYLQTIDIENNVTGIGMSLLESIGCKIPNMTDMPKLTSSNIHIPSTPAALWCWLHDDDQGKDLTGYEDGTENPLGEDARHSQLN